MYTRFRKPLLFILFVSPLIKTNCFSQIPIPNVLDFLTFGAESIRDYPTLNLFLLKDQASIQGQGLNLLCDEMKLYYERLPQDPKAQSLTQAGTGSLAKLVINNNSMEIPKEYYWFIIDLKTLEYRFLMKE